MDTIWIVTQGSRDCSDGYTWAVAAFATKEAAKGFEIDHQLWLDRMGIDDYTDCYQVPIDPEYTDGGYVLVSKDKNEGSITATPLEHVLAKWTYRGEPEEVHQEEHNTWVIVKSKDRETAKQKAVKLFKESGVE